MTSESPANRVVELVRRTHRHIFGRVRQLAPARWTARRHALLGQPPPRAVAFSQFGAGSVILPSGSVRNPSRIAIGSGVTVMEHTVLAALGDPEDAVVLTICDGARLGRFNTVVAEVGVVMGDGVVTGDSVAILDTWADPGAPTATLGGVPLPKAAPVVIGSGAYISANAKILPGVSVGGHSYVGEGAVVDDDVPPSSVVYGNPARVVSRDLTRPSS
jgi:acetyltransferase-like isoleucine patch superfamily enzyme